MEVSCLAGASASTGRYRVKYSVVCVILTISDILKAEKPDALKKSWLKIKKAVFMCQREKAEGAELL